MTYPSSAPTTGMSDMQRLARYERAKHRFAHRERNCDNIHRVRSGHIRQLFPEYLNFSVNFDGSPVANFVDVVARDIAEGLAPLPALDCTSGGMKTDADERRAKIKNRIGDNYWRHSKLEIQMLKAADRYTTYGWLPIFIEPDVDARLPCMYLEDPRHSYYELNRMGQCVFYAKRWRKSIDDLCAMFPEYADQIRTDPKADAKRKRNEKPDNAETELDLVRIVDNEAVVLLLPQRDGLRLGYYEHKMSRCPVWIAERPGADDTPRGQFDDVIWVQVARAIYATLALEGATNAVQAPIAIPDDVDEVPVGPNAIIQSENAKDIHRVDLNIPNTAFAEVQNLDSEMRTGARYPEARSGNINASVVTGKGVEALLGSFDGQIRGAQMVWREALRQATSLCFEMDQTWWPNYSKRVTGAIIGESYEFTYTPSKDINSRYDCTVTYGFTMGLAPSQSLIAILQLEGAGLIAKSTARANLPMPIDTMQEQKLADVEAMREAIRTSLQELGQGLGPMLGQGQDPTPIIKLIAQVTHGVQNGDPIETAYENALAALQAEQQQQQAQQAAQQPQAPEEAPGGAPQPFQPGGQGQNGLPPDIQRMVAGFRGNANVPVSNVEVRRDQPTGVSA